MKRAPFLFCAGADAPRYKVLESRGQFSTAEDGSPRGNAYTLADAFRLRLLLDLVGGEANDETQIVGLSPSYAAGVVTKALEMFPRHPLNQLEPLDWWVGVVVFEDKDSDGERFRWPEWYFGEIEQFAAWMNEKRQRPVAENGSYRGRFSVIRVFMVNASNAANFVRDRALELGLPEAEDYSVVERV